MYTPPHQNKASTNLNVSKPLMMLNLALNAFIFPMWARSPTYRYFIKLAFFGQLPIHSPLLCLERQSKRFYCLSRSKRLEVGDEWGHQLNKPSMLSWCPHHHFAFNARFSCTSTEHTHTLAQILEYINAHAVYKIYIDSIYCTHVSVDTCTRSFTCIHCLILMMRAFFFGRFTKKVLEIDTLSSTDFNYNTVLSRFEFFSLWVWKLLRTR